MGNMQHDSNGKVNGNQKKLAENTNYIGPPLTDRGQDAVGFTVGMVAITMKAPYYQGTPDDER